MEALEALKKLAPTKLLASLSPGPAQFAEDAYDGLEFRWKNVVFRPALFKAEGILFSLVFLYFVLAMVGSAFNSRRATAWLVSSN